MCAADARIGAERDRKRIMRRFSVTMLATLAVAGSAAFAHAQDGAIDSATAVAFDARLFATAPGNVPGKKTYACFVRHYDADHLARHPKQKVSAMQLLVTAEIQPDEKVPSYSFRLGVNYRHRPGNFDSSGYCNHAVATDAAKEVRFDCGVDCEGGGIGIALSKDDKSAIVRLERITVWQRNKPDAEAADALLAGADDKIFRLDRSGTTDCAALVTDRKELAAIRHK
jgi:hypothetical protein